MHIIIIISLVLGIIATLVGFYTSYYVNLSSGPVIVLTLTVEFLICSLIGWLKRRHSTAALSRN